MSPDSLGGIALLALLVVILGLEAAPPLRRAVVPRKHRWLTNIGLFLLGGALVGMVAPLTTTEAALGVTSGLVFDLQLPTALEILFLVLVLDFWRYWEHRLFHEMPLLWRMHLVHHSDTSLDVTTAERHHPLESIVATFITLMLVFALGISYEALITYVLLGSASALFVHANLHLPEAIDRPLRQLLVTPAVHAVHHSSDRPQTDSNYGTLLTVWDRLFNTYNDPAVTRVERFGLEYFRGTTDAELGPVLLQPFEYHRDMAPVEDDQESIPTPETASRGLSTAWMTALRNLGLGLALALIALWPTALSFFQVWSTGEIYQYAWLVIPMFIYLLAWHQRDQLLALTPRADWLGFALLVPALLLWSAAYLVDIQLGEQLALVLLLQAICLCALGRETYRALFPALAMLFFLVPSGDILQPLLRDLTVKWIEWFAILTQLPYSIDGFTVYVGEHRYLVIDACSGLTFVLMASFLGYSFGVMGGRSFGHAALMGGLGAALGVMTNALRVWLILILDLGNETPMNMAGHEGMQWLALLVTLGLLFFTTLKLSPSGLDPNTVFAGPDSRTGHSFAPILAGLAVLAIAGGGQLANQHNSSTPAASLAQIARHYPQSQLQQHGAGELRQLKIPYSAQLQAVLVESASWQGPLGEQKLGPTDRATWRHAATRKYVDCDGEKCVSFVHKTWRRKGEHPPRHTFYTYHSGDTVTASKLTYRLANGWNRLSGGAGNAGLVGFELLGQPPKANELARIYYQLREQRLPEPADDRQSDELIIGKLTAEQPASYRAKQTL